MKKNKIILSEQETTIQGIFSHAGWGMFIFYVVNSVISTLLLVVGAIIVFRSYEYFDIVYSANSITDVLASIDVLIMKNTYGIGMCLTIATIIGMTAGIIAYRMYTKKYIPYISPARHKLPVKDFLFLLFIAFAFWGVGCLIGNLPEMLGLEGTDSMSFIYEYIGDGMWSTYVYAVIGAPIFEELLLRKFFIDSVGKYDQVVACFLSALLFGIIHGNSTQFIYAFPLGLLFAVIYTNTGNVGYTILMHMIINLLGSLPQFFSYAGIDITTGWNIMFAVLTGLGILAFILYRKSRWLYLKKNNEIKNFNILSFKSFGMQVFITLGSILVLGMGVFTFASTMLDAKIVTHTSLWPPHLLLIPVYVAAAMIILTVITVGRRRKING